MKRALCFVVLINKEAKTVLDWLLSDKFIRGFHCPRFLRYENIP